MIRKRDNNDWKSVWIPDKIFRYLDFDCNFKNNYNAFTGLLIMQICCWNFTNSTNVKTRTGLVHCLDPDSAYINLIELDCSLGQFKSAKLKNKENAVSAPNFYTYLQKRYRLMHQVFNYCWQMFSCWFMSLMLYLPLLDICGTASSANSIQSIHICS